MKRLWALSTPRSALMAAAALDAGVTGTSDGELLLIADGSTAPELAFPWWLDPGADPVTGRFERVIELGGPLRPFHTAGWDPADADVALLAPLLRGSWGVGDEPVHLVVESPVAAPWSTLIRLLAPVGVTVIATTLDDWGATPQALPLRAAQLIEQVLYLDLFEGVHPVAFGELGVEYRAVDAHQLARAARTMSGPGRGGPFSPSAGAALVVAEPPGAVQGAPGDRHVRGAQAMAETALTGDLDRVVVWTGPAWTPADVALLRARLAASGPEVVVDDESPTAEVLAAGLEPRAVHSGVCVDGLSAAVVAGVEPVLHGVEEALRVVDPYHGAGRVAATLLDVRASRDERLRGPDRMREMLECVSYMMRPKARPDLRSRAVSTLEGLDDGYRLRYVGHKRLRRMGMLSLLDDPEPRGAGGGIVTSVKSRLKRILPRD